jgi:ABC-type glycerol-3-phosphate transport system permease component
MMVLAVCDGGKAMSEHVNKRTTMSIRASGRLNDLLSGLILGIAGFITFIPVTLLIEFAFKSRQQMADARWLPTLPLHFENFGRAWEVMAPGLLNSVIYVIGSVGIGLTCCTLTAYVFARYKFPGKKFLYRAILALMMIPGVLTLITSFVVVVRLKLNNTFWGVWLPLASTMQTFEVLVLRASFESLPEELFEAGRLDGARESWMLWKIAIPLSKPILLTLIVLQINNIWNEYLWPMMVISDPDYHPAVLSVMHLTSIMTAVREYGAQYAGYLMLGIPILVLFMFTSRAFIRGLTSGAIKI